MNCTNCNQPLEPQARFCRSCGFPVPTSTATNNPSLAQRNQPPFNYDVPTRATTSGSTPPAPQPPSQPWTAPQQPGFQQPTVPVSMPSNGAQAFPAKEVTPPRPRRRRGRRVLLGCLTSFIIALLVFG